MKLTRILTLFEFLRGIKEIGRVANTKSIIKGIIYIMINVFVFMLQIKLFLLNFIIIKGYQLNRGFRLHRRWLIIERFIMN